MQYISQYCELVTVPKFVSINNPARVNFIHLCIDSILMYRFDLVFLDNLATLVPPQNKYSILRTFQLIVPQNYEFDYSMAELLVLSIPKSPVSTYVNFYFCSIIMQWKFVFVNLIITSLD